MAQLTSFSKFDNLRYVRSTSSVYLPQMFFLTAPILLFLYTDAYNLDTLDPVVLTGPSKGAHFGYSAAIQKRGDEGWVLVGLFGSLVP